MPTVSQAPEEDAAPLGMFFYPAEDFAKTHGLAIGKLGELHQRLGFSRIQIFRDLAMEPGQVEVRFWNPGRTYGVVSRMSSGVTDGYGVTLELHGIGFRAEANEAENKLILRVGFSHVVELELNNGVVMYQVLQPQLVQVAGLDYAAVHQAAANLRRIRPPEPYKGKGIRYQFEEVRLREAKKK